MNNNSRFTKETAERIGREFVLATTRYGATAQFIKDVAADGSPLAFRALEVAIGVAAGQSDAKKRKDSLASWKKQVNRSRNSDESKRLSFKVDGPDVTVSWQVIPEPAAPDIAKALAQVVEAVQAGDEGVIDTLLAAIAAAQVKAEQSGQTA